MANAIMSLTLQKGVRNLCKLCIGNHSAVPIRRFNTARKNGRYVSPASRRLPSSDMYSRKPLRSRIDAHSIPRVTTKISQNTLRKIVASRVDEWAISNRLHARLDAYGFQPAMSSNFLNSWVDKVKSELENVKEENELKIPSMESLGWDSDGLIAAYESGSFSAVVEAAFLRNFLEYVASSAPSNFKFHLRSLLRATDISDIAQDHLPARTLNRTFHLHIGPTNSGKTYNALKALSRAGSGVYAGPLRLLAHEVWERINLGSVGDLDGKGRACNLLTGEERRIVDPDAGILSCTVEMLPLSGLGGKAWDVVVLDEIQMLGDSQRGGAWTSAVMGVMAKEIHLCGDETTVELLTSMISSFNGDKLEVHRYNRLTPLSVAKESLNSDWTKVTAGDCIVTFSRSNVFAIKKLVESLTGINCAVIYGALPPETRAEQARDFNSEDGRAKVLVASDAVGMGLNLKIKRIIFESLTKYDGTRDVPLSLSQVKQIAGRAGRYGMHSEKGDHTTDELASSGGSVTTFHDADIPLLRAMLPLSLPPITRATIEVPHSALSDLAPLLPPSTTFADLLNHFSALAKIPSNTILSSTAHKIPLSDIVQPFRDTLTLSETDVFCHAPVNVRDEKVANVFARIVSSYADNFLVDLLDVLRPSRLIETLETVEAMVARLSPIPSHVGQSQTYLVPPNTISTIPVLESLHKSLVLYLWLSYRLELAFPDREIAASIKTRTENALEICLERLPGVKRKMARRTDDVDNQQSSWQRKKSGKQEIVEPAIQWTQRELVAKEERRAKWNNVSVIAGRKTDTLRE